MQMRKNWNDESWNPVTGCDKISPACDNCYALGIAKRLKDQGQPKYQKDGDPRTSGPGFGLTLHPHILDAPYRWKKPRLVFLGSMSDLFHKDVPTDFIRRIFDVIRNTPNHTYQVLTKRSTRLKKLARELDWPDNLWVGVTIETQKFDYRIDHLRTLPVKTKFVGATPLLGSLSLDLTDIDFVVTGPESGQRARPMDEEWLNDLRINCEEQGVLLLTEEEFER
ncbi:MAG: phage Gp37/Gp68 family protein [Candidatus Dadabacteria bacterium]|nr:phage Gp37/Gp68 family protein [Candidatus Dadabacteria bacterium]